MYCPTCGESLTPEARECSHCGQTFGESFDDLPAAEAPNPFADDAVYEAAIVSAPRRSSGDGDPALRMVVPIGHAPLAIVSGYLGLISLLFCFLGPVAIATGALALRQNRRNPKMHGAYRAVIGIVLGAVSTFVLLAFITAAVLGGG